mmetsp:Transcript_85964/g.219082  ORF Transcript_85964/g.219082 Transcript_85964/m.219082 type:complete len:400 (+) Transcript_85964:91-1290(+)
MVLFHLQLGAPLGLLLLEVQHGINHGHSGGNLGLHAHLLSLHTIDEELGRFEVIHREVVLVRGVSVLGLGCVDLQALQDLRETDVILCVEHGPSLNRREAVAENVHDVYVGRALGEAFLEDSESLVDQGEEQALDDLLIGDLASLVALGLTDLRDFRDDLGVHHLVAALVDEDAAACGADLGIGCLQAEAVVLAEPIHELVGTHVGLCLLIHISGCLALLPEQLLAHQVAQAHRSHGHAELFGNTLHLLDRGTLLDNLLGFRSVGRDHAVADEAIAIADEHGLLAEQLAHGHACSDGLFAGLCSAHILEKLHDVGWREKVRAHATGGVLERGGDFVDIEAACVRANQSARLRVLVQFQENLLLQGHDLGDGLNDEIAVGEVLKLEGWLDECNVVLGLLL